MANQTSTLDRLSRWYLNRRLFIQDYLADHAKGRQGNRGIPIGTIGETPSSGEGYMAGSDTKNARVAMTSSWIYSDIQLLMGEVSAANLEVMKVEGEIDRPIKNHPFELLFKYPNRFFGRTFLMQYLTAWMMLDGNGYWFLAPTKRNRDELAEIWPLESARIRPIKDEKQFISGYLYKLSNTRVIRIDPYYICHFMLPNPFDQTDGLSKLTASNLPMETDIEASKFQNAFHKTGSGIPRSILSLDRDISDRNFLAVEAAIQEDFVQGDKTIAIVRAGSFDVKTVGISQTDMQLISSREFSRNEIDRVYLGMEYSRLQTEGGIRQADKMFREKGVYPLHRLISEQITLQVVRRFYGEDLMAQFEDIRLRDRAVEVQEAAVYWRVLKLNEARAQRGSQPLDGKIGPVDLKQLGELPLSLANDPVFVMTLFGMDSTGTGTVSPNSQRTRENQRQTSHPEQNVSPGVSTLSSEFVTEDDITSQFGNKGRNWLSNPDDRPGPIDEAKTDLRKWYKIACREIMEGENAGEYPFVSEFIPLEIYRPIKEGLYDAKSRDDVKRIFEVFGYSKL